MKASIRVREVLAARPPDVRKGFAFPAASSKQERLPDKGGTAANSKGIRTESQRLSAHQAASRRNHLTEGSEVLMRRKKLTDHER
jgi:hypothetical protein